MLVDVEVAVDSPAEVGELARRAEEYGFDCLWVNETRHDPFIQVALAAAATSRISVGTSIALAFTRSPTTLAYTAWDVQKLSNGRLILGLGSQVKGHIERRFGLKWETPAPKMKEVILALRAVWDSWQTGSKLDFQGNYYKLSLMTPFFNPGPIADPDIPVYLAGVNEGMCRLAGRLADGLHVHPLHTVRYLREVVVPAVEDGLSKAGRKREDFSVAASVFAAVGENRDEIANVREAYRDQIAFYASTRTYSRMMEIHGWGDAGAKLHEHSVAGEWEKMRSQVTDDMLGEFVVDGTWKEIGGRLVSRYKGLADRVRLYLPFDGSASWRSLAEGVRASR